MQDTKIFYEFHTCSGPGVVTSYTFKHCFPKSTHSVTYNVVWDNTQGKGQISNIKILQPELILLNTE